MFKKLLSPQTLIKANPAKPTFFKQINWSVSNQCKKEQLSQSVQTIAKELENTHTDDAQGPMLKATKK